MKAKLMMMLTGVCLAGAASAHGRERRGPPPPAPGRFCDDLDVTEAQKTQLRDEHLKFADERIDLEAKEKHARVEFMKILGSKPSDDKAIRRAAQAAAEATGKLLVAEELQRTETLLKVFTPEQRAKAIPCVMMMSGPHHGPLAFGPPGPRPPRVADEDDAGPAPEPVAAAE